MVDSNGLIIASSASMSDGSHHELSSLSTPIETVETDSTIKPPTYAFTTTVGKKDSHALQYVDDANDVATLLKKLASVHNRI